MRKIIILFLLFPFFSAFSQPITFEIVYGGGGNDEARSIWQTTDGGYIVAGISGSYPSGNSDVFLLKIDSVGAIMWFKFPGGTNLQAGYSVQQTSDGGFIVAGLTDAGGFGGYDVYLLKTDINGDSLWSKTYGGADWDFGYYVEETADNGFIIGGTTYSFGEGQQMYLIKTDATGDTTWTKTYGGLGLESAACVRQTTDNGYILSGSTTSYGAGEKDVYLVKTDANGDTLWTKTFGDIKDDEGTFVEQTIDGGYVLSAIRTNPTTNRNDENYIKTDGTGTQQWEQIFNSVVGDKSYVIHQRNDGTYVAAGAIDGLGGGLTDYFFLRMNGGGYPIGFVRTEGGEKNDILHSMQVANDQGLIMAGYSESYGEGLKQIYIVKTDSILSQLNDPVIIGINDKAANEIKNGITVFPVPASDNLYVFINKSISAKLKAEIVISLYDLTGKLIFNKQLFPQTINGQIEFPVSGIQNGLYVLRINSDEFSFEKKIIINH